MLVRGEVAVRQGVFASLLVAGCGFWVMHPQGSAPIVDADAALVDATVADWHSAGLPTRDVCEEQRGRMRVRWSDELSPRECQDERGLARACFVWSDGSRGAFNQGNLTPVLVVTTQVDAERQRRLLRHEALHWLASCSTGDLYGDPYHRRPEVWALDEWTP